MKRGSVLRVESIDRRVCLSQRGFQNSELEIGFDEGG
jgi:hypothetical protein